MVRAGVTIAPVCETLTGMTRHEAEVAGQRMSWLQAGQGRPVVLLHAFPMAAEMWRPQLVTVPHGRMLIAPDLPGFGAGDGTTEARSRASAAAGAAGGTGVGAAGSVGDGSAHGGTAMTRAAAVSMDEFAESVLALLRHLDIEQAAIGGLSMGGYITFALYRKAPQRFRAMILADTRADADTPEAKTNREKMQAAVRAGGSAAAADAMLEKLLGARALEADTLLASQVRDIIVRNDPQGIVNAIEALKTRPDSLPTLPQISCPTLVIVGDQDEATPPALSELMAREIPRATLAVIPGAAHLSNIQQPQAFNRALWDFV